MRQLYFSTLFLLYQLTSNGQAWNFKSVNTQGMGYVTGLIIHPNTTLAPNTIYARTDVGGVYRFDTPNQRWIPLMDNLISRDNNGPTYDVESFAIDPQSATTLYASLSGVPYYPNPAHGDIVKSTDKGQTWQSTGFLATNTMINGNAEWRGTGERMAVDPNNSDILYYGSRTNGLWRKESTWVQVSGGLPTTFTQDIAQFPGFTFVVFDKNTLSNGKSQTIYAGLWESGIWRSTDGGISWSNINGGSQPTRGVLDNNGVLYVTFAQGGGVQKFSNNAWTNITPSGQSGENFMGITVHPTEQNTLLTNTFNRQLFRSDNSGISWTTQTMNFPAGSFPAYYNTYSSTYNSTFSPFDWGSTALTFDPNSPQQVWMTNGYGVIRTQDINAGNTHDWEAVMNNLEEIVTIDIKVPPLTGGADLIATTADMVGWRIADRTVTPTITIADFDFVAFGGSVDYCQNQAQNLCFVGIDQTNLAVKYMGNSTDNGQTWTPFGDQTPGNAGVIAMSASNPLNMVWAPCCWAAPVYTTNAGNTWSACNGIAAGWQHGGSFWWNSRNLIADRVNGNKFYYIDQSELFYSNNSGANWAKGYTQLPAWHTSVNLVANPWTEGELWAAFARSRDTIGTQHHGLFHSTDGGLSFIELTSMQWVNYVTVGKGNSNSTPFLYVHGRQAGTNFDAIYKSEDRGQTWIQVSSPAQNQFANISVIEADQRTKNLVYVGTGGRGIFWGSADAALPVTYLSALQAGVKGSTIQLNWATATERDAAFFEIFRSDNGANFESIGRTPAKGHSDQRQQYHFTDNKPLTGPNYYRLKQWDKNGSFTWSNMALVDYEVIDYSIFPNPVKDQFTVTGTREWEHIVVRNSLGQVVRQFEAGSVLRLNDCLSGIYNVEIYSRNSVAPMIYVLVKE
jgi:xyloglucan-specific exo-beta-1,4-glucanase